VKFVLDRDQHSPMPNRPINRDTKPDGPSPFIDAHGDRTLPETVSIPTAAKAKPIASDTID